MFHLQIFFDGDISYDIFAKGSEYFVQSSDMSYGLRYRLRDDMDAARFIEEYGVIASSKEPGDFINPAT